MRSWFSHSTISVLLLWQACSHAPTQTEDDLLRGTITYPFVQRRPLGINAKKEKFILRTIKGDSEYVVEIPGAGEDYDIEIPMNALNGNNLTMPSHTQELPSAATTDREITDSFPNIADKNPAQSALVDKAFGVGPNNGPKQSPAYTGGTARIREYFVHRQYEYALIEVNNLLQFYPNSPELNKMKGTIYVRLNNLPLAEKSWRKALDLSPNDKILRASLTSLQAKMK